MSPYSAEDSVRRLRAIWGWSGLEQAEFIEQWQGVDTQRGKRLLRRSPAARATEEELRAAAQMAGMPESFALEGLSALAPDESALSERVDDLAAQLTELRAAVVMLAAGNVQQTRERLGLGGTGHRHEPREGVA